MSNIVELITNKVKAIFAETPEEKENLMVEAVVKDTGIKITADSWEVGQVVSTETEEGDTIAIPEGTYELEDATVLTIDAEGKITEIVLPEEVEVEAKDKEKIEEEMAAEKDKPTYVTEEQLSAVMAPIMEALQNVSVKLSAVTPKPATDADKVESENKLLKQRLSEKRKAIFDKSTAQAATPEPDGRRRVHQSQTKAALSKTLADFDFTFEKTNLQ